MVACPSCGQENPDGFRLCGMCGAPLAEPPPPREESQVVTVLFCDLVGSTAWAEFSDPEDVRALLSRYHERVRRDLERFGRVQRRVHPGFNGASSGTAPFNFQRLRLAQLFTRNRHG